jgi:hypothetical protein
VSYHLIVVHQFANYAVGQKIDDADEVAKVLDGHNHGYVVKIPAPVSDAAPTAPRATAVPPVASQD